MATVPPTRAQDNRDSTLTARFRHYVRVWRKLSIRKRYELYIRCCVAGPREIQWNKLPVDLQQDVRLARMVGPVTRYPYAIFETIPVLQQDRSFWKSILDTRELDYRSIWPLLVSFAPRHILSDTELMKSAYKHDSFCYEYMSLDLQTDVKFVEELLKSKNQRPASLFMGAFELLRRYGSSANDTRFKVYAVLNQVFEFCAKNDAWVSCIQSGSWSDPRFEWARQNRIVLEYWFKAGLPYSRKACAFSLETDQKVFLLIAENCIPKYKEESFLFASQELRSDKAFMMKVIAKDPSLVSCASLELQQDFDVGILAFSSSPDVVKHYMAGTIQIARIRILQRLYKHIESFIQSVNAFREYVRWVEATFPLESFDPPLWHNISNFLFGTVLKKEIVAMEQAGRHLALSGFCDTGNSELLLNKAMEIPYDGSFFAKQNTTSKT